MYTSVIESNISHATKNRGNETGFFQAKEEIESVLMRK